MFEAFIPTPFFRQFARIFLNALRCGALLIIALTVTMAASGTAQAETPYKKLARETRIQLPMSSAPAAASPVRAMSLLAPAGSNPKDKGYLVGEAFNLSTYKIEFQSFDLGGQSFSVINPDLTAYSYNNFVVAIDHDKHIYYSEVIDYSSPSFKYDLYATDIATGLQNKIGELAQHVDAMQFIAATGKIVGVTTSVIINGALGFQVVSIDPATAQQTVLGSYSGYIDRLFPEAPPPSAYDPGKNAVYLIGNDGTDTFVMSVNATNGALTRIPIQICTASGVPCQATAPNCTQSGDADGRSIDKRLFLFAPDPTGNFLVGYGYWGSCKINLATGEMSKIGPYNDGLGGDFFVESAYDAANHILYYQGVPVGASTISIIGFDTATGAMAYNFASSRTNPLLPFVYDNVTQVSLIDPVPMNPGDPSLLSGPAITRDTTLLATQGRIVQGVATDGVAQVVIRIAASVVGEEFPLSINPTQCPSLTLDDCGLLFDPLTLNPPANVFSSASTGSLTVTAVSTPKGPMAFAAYRAPVDFVRSGTPSISTSSTSAQAAPPSMSDQDSSQRSVFVSINSQQNGAQPDLEIKLVRPPVVLVHGLWATADDLADLTALESDTRFFAGRVNYGANVDVTDSNPPMPILGIFTIPTGSSLGFRYGAEVTSSKLHSQFMPDFKSGNNTPFHVPVAAVGVDLVAHSMGALVSRTLRLRSDYYQDANYQHGYIHKIISIGGPHLGSPLATEILTSENTCTRSLIAATVNFSFGGCSKCVTANNTQTDDGTYIGSGAIGDLQGNVNGGGLSSALQILQSSPPVPLPIAYLTGQMTNDQIDKLIQQQIPNRTVCDNHNRCHQVISPINNIQRLRYLCHSDPITAHFTTPDAFRAFLSDASDGIVPLNSQLNGKKNYGLTPIQGVLHSPGTGRLYNLFNEPKEPTELTNPIADSVSKLLNTAVTQFSIFLQ